MTPLPLLGAACLAGAALLAAELLQSSPPAPPAAALAAPAPGAIAGSGPGTGAAPAGAIAALVETVLARPLLAPDRRPAVARAAAGAAQPPALPRLAGIVFAPELRRAIFQAAGGKPVALGEGGRVLDWTIARIERDQVTLDRAGETRQLVPRYDGKPPPAPAKPAKRPPTRWEAAAPQGILRARWSNPQLQPRRRRAGGGRPAGDSPVPGPRPAEASNRAAAATHRLCGRTL